MRIGQTGGKKNAIPTEPSGRLSKVCPCIHIMVSKRFVQMVFPFLRRKQKERLSWKNWPWVQQNEEDVFDFGGMRRLRISEGVIHSPTSHRTCDVAALRQLWTRKSSVAQWAVCVCSYWILLYINSSSYWLTSCEVGYQPHQLWIYLPCVNHMFLDASKLRGESCEKSSYV